PGTESDWWVEEERSRDVGEIRPRVRQGPPLLAVGVRLTMSDDAWRPPGGVFNPDILVQPGTFSDVEHGFGFFGSVNQHEPEWVLYPELLEKLGVAGPR